MNARIKNSVVGIGCIAATLFFGLLSSSCEKDLYGSAVNRPPPQNYQLSTHSFKDLEKIHNFLKLTMQHDAKSVQGHQQTGLYLALK